jgi:hypothetical protein
MYILTMCVLFRKKCVACFEQNEKVTSVPCDHFYHHTCLRDLFMAAIQDESLMPPRCCRQTIPVHLAHMNLEERERFNSKLLEYSTVDRVYCSQQTCSTFIPPQSIVDSIGTCPK